MEHTRMEKDLKRDIVAKNTLLKEVRRMNRKVSEWQIRSGRVKNRRQEKKYKATIARFIRELSRLQPRALQLVQELDRRIHEEMDFSKQEVKDFKERLQVETEEMGKITRSLEEVEKKLKQDEERLAGAREQKEEKVRTDKIREAVEKERAREMKLRKKAREEARTVEKLKREIKSEASDKKLFKKELKRIGEEKEVLSQNPLPEESSAEPAKSEEDPGKS